MHKNTWPPRNGCRILCSPPFSGTQKGMTSFPFSPAQPLLINDRSLKGGGRPTHLLPHAKMLLVPISFFPCWVDNALESSAFSLSKCDFSSLFHIERSWYTCRFTVVFVSSRKDLLSDARAFSLTPFEAWSWTRVFIFSKVPSRSE